MAEANHVVVLSHIGYLDESDCKEELTSFPQPVRNLGEVSEFITKEA